MLVCVLLLGQLDSNSAVEIVIYTLSDTAICEFLSLASIYLAFSPMHIMYSIFSMYIQHWTIL